MKKMTIHNYADPGHSWFKVARKVLDKLGIADKISSYSYQREDFVYLEEDCDATVFFNAAAACNIQVKEIYHHTNKQSKMRGYDCYIPK